jgi:hypothetical protein
MARDPWAGQSQAAREERFRALVDDLCNAVIEGRQPDEWMPAPSLPAVLRKHARAMRVALKRAGKSGGTVRNET